MASTIVLILSFIVIAVNSEKVPTNCTSLLDVFADSAAEFTSCAISNSRPITLCESCVEPYLNVLNSYNNMTKFADNESVCINQFINLDRLEIVQTLYHNSYNLWNRAKCYECFEFVNGSLTPQKSNETNQFNDKFDNFMKCIHRSNVNDTTVCSTCIEYYLSLNNYYLSISNENEKIGVCMDIVDLMNTTRSLWSVKCCRYRKHDEYVFLGSVAAILLATPLFYVIAQLCTERKVPAILTQNRFATSLSINRSSF